MERALRSVGFEVIRLENATKQQMERAIRQFSQRLTPGTVSLVYYAGHGIQVNGHNYLVPVDAQVDTEPSVRLEAVDVDEVLDQMTMAKSRVNIVILDACRNNPFERRFRSVSGGLASVDAPAGTLIAYATAPGKVAADGGGENGLYTSELIRAITTPGASIEEVFKQTRVAVMRHSTGSQTPWESSSLTGDFSFRPPNPTPTNPSAALAPDPTAKGHDGVWEGTMACGADKNSAGSTRPLVMIVRNGEMRYEGRTSSGDKLGAGFAGVVSNANTVSLDGEGVCGIPACLGHPFHIHFTGRIDGDQFNATGNWGSRSCTLRATRGFR